MNFGTFGIAWERDELVDDDNNLDPGVYQRLVLYVGSTRLPFDDPRNASDRTNGASWSNSGVTFTPDVPVELRVTQLPLSAVSLSADASLSSLGVLKGDLHGNPVPLRPSVFSPFITRYAALVDAGTSHVSVQPIFCGAECSTTAVLSESRFNVNRAVYSYADTTGYRVREMSVERVNQIGRDRQFRVVLTVASDWTVDLQNMVLVVDHNGQQYRLPFRIAKRSGHGRTFTWLEWTESSALVWGRGSTPELRIEANATGLDTVRVYYDGTHVVFDRATNRPQPKPVEGFRRWDIARAKPYDSSFVSGWDGDRAYIAVIPGEFVALNAAQGKLTTTQAKLRLSGTAPGSHVEYAKTSFGRPLPSSGWTALDSGGFTEAIELDAASKNTYVWVKVTNGNQVATHLVIIDPPPRTYKVNPELRVTEGEEATVTVSLASPAPQPEPEPEPRQEQQQQSGSASDSDLPAIVQQYDKDGSGKIESGEWALAIADYSAQKLTTPQIQVIARHRG